MWLIGKSTNLLNVISDEVMNESIGTVFGK